MPQISVIVPIYRVEDCLRQCVDSVLGQSAADLEVILVDDGSPDGCAEICAEYAALDRRVKVIRQPNQGLAAARNFCAAAGLRPQRRGRRFCFPVRRG